MILMLAIVMAVQAHVERQPVDATRVATSAPRQVLSVAVEDLGGDPDRLAWSPDKQLLYLRATKTDRWGNQTVHHYEIRLSDGRLRPVDREPTWSGRYWEWKAALAAPGTPAFRIGVETRDERRTATGVDTGGALLGGGADPSLGANLGPQGSAIAGIAVQAQMVRTTTLTLKGELLAQFVNTTPTAGLTYGWAPARMDAVVYVSRKSRLVIMDRAGRKHEVPSVTDALLPGWSDDGTRLAWLQRLGGKRLALAVMDVTAG